MERIVLLLPTLAFAQSLVWLEPPATFESKVFSVSADGSLVVGQLIAPNQEPVAFAWSNGRSHLLPEIGLRQSAARCVSLDGHTIVGWLRDEYGYPVAFRLTPTSADLLGALGPAGSAATSCSADGSVVVGWTSVEGSVRHAFRWTKETGMLDLGTLGGAESIAAAVSADGRVIVGRAHSELGEWRAVRWVEGDPQDLGALGGTWAEAFGVSADGSVVVGWAEHPTGAMGAFRWKEDEGMRDLGTLGGAQSKALAVSADGSVVVGWSETPQGTRRAFRWTEKSGMEDLTDAYRFLLTDSSELREARAITPDGRFIVGWGYHASTGRLEAFLLDTRATGSSTSSSQHPGVTLRIEPQPVEEGAVVRYSLPEALLVRLELTDALGRRSTMLFEGWQPAGVYTHPLPPLAPGVYFCHLHWGEQSLTAPLVVLH